MPGTICVVSSGSEHGRRADPPGNVTGAQTPGSFHRHPKQPKKDDVPSLNAMKPKDVLAVENQLWQTTSNKQGSKESIGTEVERKQSTNTNGKEQRINMHQAEHCPNNDLHVVSRQRDGAFSVSRPGMLSEERGSSRIRQSVHSSKLASGNDTRANKSAGESRRKRRQARERHPAVVLTNGNRLEMELRQMDPKIEPDRKWIEL